MSKIKKILLGVFTFWPLVYLFIFFAFFISTFLSFAKPGVVSGKIPTQFLIIFPLHLLTMLDTLVLLIIYIRNVFKNENVKGDKKMLWAVVLFMGNMVAMPIYWYLYYWKNQVNAVASVPTQQQPTQIPPASQIPPGNI